MILLSLFGKTLADLVADMIHFWSAYDPGYGFRMDVNEFLQGLTAEGSCSVL